MKNIENKREILPQLGVVLEESASSLTQGNFGVGGEGHIKPYPKKR